MSQQELATPKTKLHPRDKGSPQHQAWKRAIGKGVRTSVKRRRKGGLLSLRELIERGPFSRRALLDFMDAGELLFWPTGLTRYVFEEEYERFLRSKIKGGEAA
jgi:hypothetical protein